MIDPKTLTNIILRVTRLLFCCPNRSRLPTCSCFALFSLFLLDFVLFHWNRFRVNWMLDAFYYDYLLFYLFVVRKHVTSALDCHFLASISSNLNHLLQYFFVTWTWIKYITNLFFWSNDECFIRRIMILLTCHWNTCNLHTYQSNHFR